MSARTVGEQYPWRFKKGQSGNPNGRPKGTLTKRTREIAEVAMAKGLAPLQVMLEAMHDAYDRGDYPAAAGSVKDPAPYCHSRLSAIEHAGPDGGGITVQIVRFSDIEDSVEEDNTDR